MVVDHYLEKRKKKRYFLILIGYSLKKIKGNQWSS
jgi:hypothetical protein